MIVPLNNHGERRCSVLDLFGQHVAGFHIRNQQDIGVAGHRRIDALGLGRGFGYNIIESQWTV
jgi:hypothetical protein